MLVPVILAGLSMLGPFSIDTPFPAFPTMGDELGATSSEMQLVVSAYLLAFAVMSPFHGPLSDALGRKPVMVGGVLVYVAASVGCAFSTSLPVLLGFRVLQGLSAGGGVIVSRTIVRDMFDGAEIDGLLRLSILSMTDEEKAEMRAADPRAREILERTEAMTPEELMRLHGTVRDLQVRP